MPVWRTPPRPAGVRCTCDSLIPPPAAQGRGSTRSPRNRSGARASMTCTVALGSAAARAFVVIHRVSSGCSQKVVGVGSGSSVVRAPPMACQAWNPQSKSASRGSPSRARNACAETRSGGNGLFVVICVSPGSSPRHLSRVQPSPVQRRRLRWLDDDAGREPCAWPGLYRRRSRRCPTGWISCLSTHERGGCATKAATDPPDMP